MVLEFLFGFRERRLRKVDEKAFRNFIDTTVSRDLRCAMMLSSTPYSKRTDFQKSFFDSFVKRYIENQKCIHESYENVPVSLRREYNILHRKIMETLLSAQNPVF